MFGAPKTKDLTPRQVKAGLDAGEILLVDVRDPADFAAERIEGAVNLPLSVFNPDALPLAGDKVLVLQCGSGKRSTNAVGLCRQAGQVIDTHLSGGIAAWKAAGFPTASGAARKSD
jgi:rhodanese-related sulfurtransferase